MIARLNMYCYFIAANIFALFSDCNACFQMNMSEIRSIATGIGYYQECQCTEPGYTVNDLIWLDNNGQPIEIGLGTSSDVYAEQTPESLNLIVKRISKTMSGTYKCITKVNGLEYVQSYTIEAYDPLYFYGSPDHQYLVNDRDWPIICKIRGDSDPLIRWQIKKGDGAYKEINNNEKYHITSEGLLVRNVTMDDEGIYKCTAQGITTGEAVDNFIKVEVTIRPSIQELKATPGSVVLTGASVSIDCIAEGKPSPQYIWRKVEEEPNNETVTWIQNINTITFENVQSDDRGTYQCVAYNSAGNTTMDIFLEVLEAPKIIDFPKITAREGETIQVSCNATGRSEPNITILYALNPSEGEYEVISNNALIYVNRSDEGTYICNASNEVDFVTAEMYLTVLHKPYFEQENETIWGWDGKTINLSCVHDSNPPSVITWRFDSNEISTAEQVEYNKMLLELLNKVKENYLTIHLNKNSSYGDYYCTAKNVIGEVTKKISLKEAFRPTAVDNVTILEITPTTASFYIYSEFDRPKALGFTAQYDEAANYNITDIHLNRTWAVGRPYKLEKLKPNTKYYVSFAAVNEMGEGVWTENIEFDTLEKTVPDSPTLVSESVRFSSVSNSLVLKWEAPDDNGDPIDYYTIRYCPQDEAEVEQLKSSETSEEYVEENDEMETKDKPCKMKRVLSTTETEIKDLKYNTSYFLEIIAHNAKGYSNAVNISVTVSEPDTTVLASTLSGGTIIGLSIVIVIICLLLFDLILLVWRRQGVIASVCIKSKKEKKENALNARDKKGLLRESTDDKRSNNGHKEFEYNKNTGTVTGKHSAV